MYASETSGALYPANGGQDNTGNGNVGSGIGIDASRVSNVYQDNLTEVRPNNYAVNFYIKY